MGRRGARSGTRRVRASPLPEDAKARTKERLAASQAGCCRCRWSLARRCRPACRIGPRTNEARNGGRHREREASRAIAEAHRRGVGEGRIVPLDRRPHLHAGRQVPFRRGERQTNTRRDSPPNGSAECSSRTTASTPTDLTAKSPAATSLSHSIGHSSRFALTPIFLNRINLHKPSEPENCDMCLEHTKTPAISDRAAPVLPCAPLPRRHTPVLRRFEPKRIATAVAPVTPRRSRLCDTLPCAGPL